MEATIHAYETVDHEGRTVRRAFALRDLEEDLQEDELEDPDAGELA